MSDWSSGYVVEVDYLSGYYKELSPAHLEYAMLSKRIDFQLKDDLKYLELGFGNGVSLNVHAASNPGQFWGTDFMPSHALKAQEMAASWGGDIKIFSDSFEQLLDRPDLPMFDVITLHGIWSWVSRENQNIILKIIRDHLSPGGVVYISYNCLPGWAKFSPMRHLVKTYDTLMSKPDADMRTRVQDAFGFSKKLSVLGANYFRSDDRITKRLEETAKKDFRYLAHEFFNAEWRAVYFSEIAADMESADMSFGGSANLIDHVDNINLTSQESSFLSDLDNLTMRETARDFILNRQFRRDVWVKKPKFMSLEEQAERLRKMRFILLKQPQFISVELKTERGKISLPPELLSPLVNALAKNEFVPKSFDELLTVLPNLGFGTLAQGLLLLVGGGHVSLAQSEDRIATAQSRSRALNSKFTDIATISDDVTVLASPVTGNGVALKLGGQLILEKIALGNRNADEIAKSVWSKMKNGRSQEYVRSQEEANILATLGRRAANQIEHLSVLKALGLL